jgi:hypothetical protein
MKKLLISLFLAVLAATSGAQQSGGSLPTGSPYTTPSYTATTPPAITFSQKDFWMEGAYCSVQRVMGRPDMVRFVSSSPEQMSAPFIEACLRGLKAAKWQQVTMTSVERLPHVIESLRLARTGAMACMITAEPYMPILYEVRFSSFIFTGKDRELKECLGAASEAEDKIIPPPQYEPSTRPSNDNA